MWNDLRGKTKIGSGTWRLQSRLWFTSSWYFYEQMPTIQLYSLWKYCHSMAEWESVVPQGAPHTCPEGICDTIGKYSQMQNIMGNQLSLFHGPRCMMYKQVGWKIRTIRMSGQREHIKTIEKGKDYTPSWEYTIVNIVSSQYTNKYTNLFSS